MSERIDKACYKVLLNAGTLPKDKLEHLRREAQTTHIPFDEFVVQSGLISERELLKLYAKDLGAECIELKTITVKTELIQTVPVKLVWYYKFFPVKFEKQKLTIAVSKPFDVHTLDEIRFGIGRELEVVFAPKKDIEEMLKKHYGLGSDTLDKILTQTPESEKFEPLPIHEEKEEDIEKLAETASVVQLVNQIILEACKKRASDIHIEPARGKFRLRYRIDGILHEMPVPPQMNQFMMPILSRIKIMANLNIVERRLPQDGKARVKTQDEILNLRISSLPTPHGESVVIRILPSKTSFRLGELGFESNNLRKFKDLIQHTHGIIFVTGPTGSGKSTTLYAALNTLNTGDRKILTLEDPIEYEIPGIIQMQVLPEIGLNFARGLRSMLRHDPDIMMVGEVRDLETADIAIRVSLTGHLILSTLHTNDAAGGITRLTDIGVEPYLIASSVIGFMAQRLVRVLCPRCKVEDHDVMPEVEQMIRGDLGLPQQQSFKIFKPKGCDDCGATGFAGRMAIHEILVMNADIRKQIMSGAPADAVKAKAREQGMATMRQDGWRKVLLGFTTPEEVIRATPMDEAPSKTVLASAQAETEYFVLPEKKSRLPGEEGAISFRERRKYVRVRVRLDVLFRTIETGREGLSPEELKPFAGEGESENISAGGIAFNTVEKLLPGDILEVKIDLSDGQAPLQAIGRVLRISCKAAESKSQEPEYPFQAAFSFLAIHSNDRRRIENYCNHIQDKKPS